MEVSVQTSIAFQSCSLLISIVSKSLKALAPTDDQYTAESEYTGEASESEGVEEEENDETDGIPKPNPLANHQRRRSVRAMLDEKRGTLTRPQNKTPTEKDRGNIDNMEAEELNLIIVTLRKRIQELEGLRQPSMNELLKKDKDDLHEQYIREVEKRKQLEMDLVMVSSELHYARESKKQLEEENRKLKELIDEEPKLNAELQVMNAKIQTLLSLNQQIRSQFEQIKK